MKPEAFSETSSSTGLRSAQGASSYRMLRIIAGTSLLWAGAAMATPTPPQSLSACQGAVKNAAAKFVQGKIAAVSTCLQAISGDMIKNGLSGPSTASAKACASQFRKIHDTRGKGMSLEEKKAAAIKKKCDPATVLTININDITGNAGGLSPAPGIDTNNIQAWCQRFGVASITTLSDWITCIDDSHECAGDLSISAQYPRALEWLGLVRPLINGLTPPSTDLTKYSDALVALDAVKAEIDGTPSGDNVPDIECGKPLPNACSPACCYIHIPGVGAPTSCFEYTGTASEVAAFMANCTGKTSVPPSLANIAVAGPCTVDPVTTVACTSAPPNGTLIPKDSTCP